MTHYQPQFPYGPPAQDHPKATTILVLGILSLVVCGVLGPFAWAMGNGALREIDASRGMLGGRSSVSAGRICGMIATLLLVLAFVAVIGVFVLGAAVSTSP